MPPRSPRSPPRHGPRRYLARRAGLVWASFSALSSPRSGSSGCRGRRLDVPPQGRVVDEELVREVGDEAGEILVLIGAPALEQVGQALFHGPRQARQGLAAGGGRLVGGRDARGGGRQRGGDR